jgi:hypothetical protein
MALPVCFLREYQAAIEIEQVGHFSRTGKEEILLDFPD